MLTKDLAICIRAHDYSETSQIVTFFTKATGKISAIAKGSKRPKSSFDGPIEVFSFGRIVFSDPGKDRLVTLTEFEQEAGFGALARRLFDLHCCLFAAELVNGLTDDYDPHPELFDQLLQFLRGAEAGEPGERGQMGVLLLLILFQLALLKEAGLRPILSGCVSCRTAFSAGWGRSYFSSTANGLICRDCEAGFVDKVGVTRESAACLANLNLLAKADKQLLTEIENIFIYHFTGLLHHRPKMAKFISKNLGA